MSTAVPDADMSIPSNNNNTINNKELQDFRLATAKSNLKYLYDPKNAAHQPAHLRTRALLRSARYLAIFIFWRLIRYAKYAAVGAITAAVASTAIGSVVSGAAFVIAPTGIVGGATMGLVWAVAKFGFRRVRNKMSRGGEGGDSARDARMEERGDAEGLDLGEKRALEVRKPAARVEPW